MKQKSKHLQGRPLVIQGVINGYLTGFIALLKEVIAPFITSRVPTLWWSFFFQDGAVAQGERQDGHL